MKRIALFVILYLCSLTLFSQTKLQKVWETGSGLKTPESALYDAKKELIYVSNIGEQGKSGSGFISQLGKDGKIIKLDWVTGLNAVKGMGLYKNKLYVAEPNAVVVIDVAKATITNRISVDGAQFLNDITVDDKGVVYVSDSRTGKVHEITNGTAKTYLENLKNVNGLLAQGSQLYLLADGALYKSNKDKETVKLAGDMDKSTDGVVMLKPGEFVVTSWAGTIYHVKENAPVNLLSDTRADKINAADLGYDKKDNVIYVPTFFHNTVVAYKLQ